MVAAEGKSSEKEPSSADLDKWRKNDRKALNAISQTINDSELIHVRNAANSAAAWKKLSEIYEAKGISRESSLRKQLYTLKLAEGDSIQQHINRFMDIVDQLKGIAVTLDDRSMASVFLDTLPKLYNLLKVSLGNIPTMITMDLVMSWTLEEEARLREEDENDNNDKAALLTKKGKTFWKNGKGDKKSTYDKLKIECFHCGKIGHKKYECQKFKTENKKKGETNDDGKSAMIMITEIDNDDAYASLKDPFRVDYKVRENVKLAWRNQDMNKYDTSDRDDRCTGVLCLVRVFWARESKTPQGNLSKVYRKD